MSWRGSWKAITVTATEPRATGAQAEQLAVGYGGRRVLAGVDLDARPGTITVIVGPNASGKTTLLSVLATLDRPLAGRLSVAGLDPRTQSAGLRAAIGLVAHRPLLYPDLSAAENLRFYALLHGLPEADRRVELALRSVSLWPRRRDRVQMLSRGLQQRLAIARALLHQPPVLLFDEPYTGLDPFSSADLDARLRQLAAAGHTVVVTSHDLARVNSLANWVVLLARGRVAWQGPPGGAGAEGLAGLYRRLTRGGAMEVGPVAGPIAAANEGVSRVTGTGYLAADANLKVGAPDTPLPGLGSAIRALVWKDLVVEWRAREIVPPVLVFALAALVVFHFTMATEPRLEPVVAPGALWVALVFGSMLGLARLVGGEVDSGCLTGLLVSPADRGGLFLGKWLAGYTFSLVVAAVLLPAFMVLLNLPAAALPGLAGVVALGLVGWQAAGTLMATLAVTARAREVLLPVLLLPVVLPLLIAAVQASAGVLGGWPLAEILPALVLVGAYGMIFLVLGFLLYPLVLESLS